MKKLEDYEIEFIEYTGLGMQADGLPKIAGRIFGLLLLTEEPISFSSLVEVLQISRGSASTNTRLLESLGVLDKVSLMGERQTHFRLPENAYSKLLEGYVGRKSSLLEKLDQTVEQASKKSFSRKRLEDHQKFYRATIANTELLIAQLKEMK